MIGSGSRPIFARIMPSGLRVRSPDCNLLFSPTYRCRTSTPPTIQPSDLPAITLSLASTVLPGAGTKHHRKNGNAATARFTNSVTSINPGGFGSNWCGASFVVAGKFDLTAMSNLK